MKVCESEYRQVGGTDDDEEIQDVDDFAQMEWVNTFFSAAPTQEVVGTSQLGAPHPRCRTTLRWSRRLFLSRVVGPLARPSRRSH